MEKVQKDSEEVLKAHQHDTKQGDNRTETQPFHKGSAAAPAPLRELPCSSEAAAAAFGSS